ncbi:replicative DNA helicase [Pseudogemmatithrix spongiicola]|uniref:Replicative DNA helicase n=1 Tax=Pseudogemmatithrix spongiicola TaxID=3062599 RepID=A0AA49Q501_9BACT|nr:replicative DNA helicase [Gemmatimonadaceae bacterium 'strain 138']WKW15162.1 replicative DNA helicase [Gemmatimonadaceae bacterium 'strain 318']
MSSSPVEFSIARKGPPDAFADRRPPWSEDAERAVLAAMLLSGDAIVTALELVTEDMFYREGHRRLFRSMQAIHNGGAVVDPLTLSNELEQRGDLQAAGGKEYIGGLLDEIPTAANVEHHCRIVRDKALRRRLIETATSLVREGHESPAEIAELLDLAEHKILELNDQRGSEGFIRIKSLLWSAMERIEVLRTAGGSITGVPSGFVDLDKMTLGFQPSDLVIVAARPSMGKTAFVLNVAQYAAIEGNVPTAIFSLEMSTQSLLLRMLASEGYVDAQRLRSGQLTAQDASNLAKAAALLGQAPIWIDDTPGLSVLEVRSRARRLKSQADIKLIIVDYLQLLSGPPNSESRQQEVSAISRSLKALAKELEVPVLALSQLSRASEQRGGENRRPQLSDLRDSGAIEQDADVVLFIYRPEMNERPYDDQGNPRMVSGTTDIPLDGYAEVIVGKQRNGPTGHIRLHYRKSHTRFENWTSRQHEG